MERKGTGGTRCSRITCCMWGWYKMFKNYLLYVVFRLYITPYSNMNCGYLYIRFKLMSLVPQQTLIVTHSLPVASSPAVNLKTCSTLRLIIALCAPPIPLRILEPHHLHYRHSSQNSTFHRHCLSFHPHSFFLTYLNQC